MISVHRTKGAGRPPKLHLPRNLQIRAHAPLHLRNQLTTTSRSRRASKGTCFLFSLPPSGYSRSPDKALPKFLLWHLTNFCRLKSPRARVNPPSRSISAFLHPCVEPNFLCRSDTSSHRKSKQRRRPIKIERRRTETGKESVIFLPSSLPAFHSVLTVVGDWTLGPIQEPFNTLLTKDLLIHLLLPKRY